jgi:hypothetical protein
VPRPKACSVSAAESLKRCRLNSWAFRVEIARNSIFFFSGAHVTFADQVKLDNCADRQEFAWSAVALTMIGHIGRQNLPSITVRPSPEEKARFATLAAVSGLSESALAMEAIRMVIGPDATPTGTADHNSIAPRGS